MKKLMILAVLAFITATAFRQSAVRISGTVRDERGMPVAGARVSAGQHFAVTDTSGNFVLFCDEQQKYLTVSGPGLQTQVFRVRPSTMNMVVLRTPGEDPSTRMVKSPPVPGASDAFVPVDRPDPSQKQSFDAYIYRPTYNTESYSHFAENAFHRASDEPLSTFSIDVDQASYGNVRRYLNHNELPPAGAVRTEEMINYFHYRYPQPTGDDPFSITTEMSTCPWNRQNRLVLIGLQGKIIPPGKLPASNLVFLVDVSGSMMEPNKLPLVKQSLKLLTEQLRGIDRISIVVYAGTAGLVLPATRGDQKEKIKSAIDALEAGGSTAGGAGIRLAYEIAKKNFTREGNNRIILCTDGDFNVGPSSDDALVQLIETERNQGIYLSVLGFGVGNYKDSKMEQLADNGNGNYAYIDGLAEAQKVLVREFGGTLFTIARDVKLQVEFNPAVVAGYRLIGYEDRLLQKEEFNDDAKDAGEIGSGHTVTALYEIVPAGVASPFLGSVDPLKYQQAPGTRAGNTAELLTVKFRYKPPRQETSRLIVHPVAATVSTWETVSANFRFASAVAEFGLLLRNSRFRENATFPQVIRMAQGSMDDDPGGTRSEFLALVKKASWLSGQRGDLGSR